MRGEDLIVELELVDALDGSVTRRYGAARFPLSVGGETTDIPIPGLRDGDQGATSPLAYFGLSVGGMFVQPAESARVSVNGTLVTTSHWLHHGDSVRIGSTILEVEDQGGVMRIRLRDTLRPVAPTPAPPKVESASVVAIKPILFEPKSLDELRRETRPLHPGLVLLLLAGALFGAAGWFIFTARSVAIDIEPPPDHFRIDGNLFDVALGGRFLLRPGTYRVVADKEGFRPLERDIEVSDSEAQQFQFALEKLPGLLLITTRPESGAMVTVDGQARGASPLPPIELTPGEHTVVVRRDRYRVFTTKVNIEGEATRVELDVPLEPLAAKVTFVSDPPGATVRLDGRAYGPTPVSVELLEGNHEFQAELPGRNPEHGRLRVVAGEDRTVRIGELSPVDGTVDLLSVPGEASVTVDGTYRGRTPLRLTVAPGRSHRVEVARDGYDTKADDIEVSSGENLARTITLEPRLGEIEILVDPPDASLYINGEARGAARQVLQLPSVSQRIEIRKEGYESFVTDITPRPDFPQTIETKLASLESRNKAASLPATLSSPHGYELVLVAPRRFHMGAPRREPGRRANEAEHLVEITRPFYLATTEVTNRQFREFQKAHKSGALQSQNLEIDHHPTVRVTWEEAAAYCNWLSASESLPSAYVASGSTYVLASPPNRGYRLPTEAEWALAARYASGVATKYAWGDSLPIPERAGNFADESAAGLVPTTLPKYNDSFAGTAPAQSFAPNALGIYNLGGNVAEWVNDNYAINPYGPGEARDPLGPDKGEFHVIRGASFLRGSITQLRLSYRDYGKDPRPDLGFRIARWAQ